MDTLSTEFNVEAAEIAGEFKVNVAATRCAVCRLKLTDSVSQEFGIGPICRAKYGFDQPVSNESRLIANKVVYAIAVGVTIPELSVHCDTLAGLGFNKLVEVLYKNNASLTVKSVEGELQIKLARANGAFSRAVYRVGGRYYLSARMFTAPDTVKVRCELWAAAKVAFRGELVWGDKGCRVA